MPSQPQETMNDAKQALAMLAAAEIIHSSDTVATAVSRVASEITARLANCYPVLLCVLNGGVTFAGQLMTQLTFPLDFDYVHVGRYGQARRGRDLSWRVEPAIALRGRTVLVVDDILDEGLTLLAIRERLLELGAAACYTAVVADKQHGRPKPIRGDFVALSVPDRFVFGYGMDARGAWRNLPAIYALRDD